MLQLRCISMHMIFFSTTPPLIDFVCRSDDARVISSDGDDASDTPASTIPLTSESSRRRLSGTKSAASTGSGSFTTSWREFWRAHRSKSDEPRNHAPSDVSPEKHSLPPVLASLFSKETLIPQGQWDEFGIAVVGHSTQRAHLVASLCSPLDVRPYMQCHFVLENRVHVSVVEASSVAAKHHFSRARVLHFLAIDVTATGIQGLPAATASFVKSIGRATKYAHPPIVVVLFSANKSEREAISADAARLCRGVRQVIFAPKATRKYRAMIANALKASGLHQPVPIAYFAVRDALLALHKIGRKLMGVEEFHELAIRHGLNDGEEVGAFLHAHGLITWHRH